MSPAELAQLDLSGRLSAALAVVNAIGDNVPSGDAYRVAHERWDSVLNLAGAAMDVLRLAMVDCEALEGATKANRV